MLHCMRSERLILAAVMMYDIKRSKLLSMAVKIYPLLIIMQYLPNIGNNSTQGNRACVYTAVLVVDSIRAAMLYSCCICYYCLIISKREWMLVIIVKMEGKKIASWAFYLIE
jgi:hypothetical protein